MKIDMTDHLVGFTEGEQNKRAADGVYRGIENNCYILDPGLLECDMRRNYGELSSDERMYEFIMDELIHQQGKLIKIPVYSVCDSIHLYESAPRNPKPGWLIHVEKVTEYNPEKLKMFLE